MGPTDILSTIFDIAKTIYEQVQKAKANQEQCKTLAKRVEIVVQAVKKLETIKDKSQYKDGLVALLETLQECLQFMREFSEEESWFKKVLKFFQAGSHQEKFGELNGALQKAINQLNLGLNAQHIFNREKDKADQKTDMAYLKSKEEEIIQLNLNAITKIDKLSINEAERHELIIQQFRSLVSCMKDTKINITKFIENQQSGSIAKMEEALKKILIEAKPEKPLVDTRYLIPAFELTFIKKIAEGESAHIYLGTWLTQKVAIKTLEGEFTTEEQQAFIREINIMSRLRHPNMTTFYGASLEAGRVCLVMEYMQQYSLWEVLKKRKLSVEEQRDVALDIAQGLYYLHQQKIFHRHLKSSHILLDKHGKAKITDFGLSKSQAASIHTASKHSTQFAWQAPECLRQRGDYHPKSDIYSFGVILWEILTGNQPYAGLKEQEIITRILSGRHEDIPASIPDFYMQLIKTCWQTDINQRPELIEIIHALEAYQPRPTSPTPETMYQQGIVCEKEKNFAKAAEFYQRAASKNYPRAKTNLGMFFLQGKGGVSKDKKQAYQYFFEAASQNHVRAMENLATMLELGDGVEKNLEEALKWYKKAASSGGKVEDRIQSITRTLKESDHYRGNLYTQQL